MYSIIYFSPTGNAKHLAKLLGVELKVPEEDIQALEFTDPLQLKVNKHLVLLYPIHGFNAARAAKRFVKELPSGIFEAISLIAVGCASHWVNGAVSLDLRKTLRKKHYKVYADEILAMPLTFVLSFPEELSLKTIAESEKQIPDIASRIARREVSQRRVLFKSRLISFLLKWESSAARLFGLELRANDNCTSCGTCWTNCPEKNIKEKDNGKPGFGFSCSMCLRCIYNCPEQAISPRFSKFVPIKKGYSLSNIIKDKI